MKISTDARLQDPERKILAIDVGLKKIGVAVLLCGVAVPLPAILRKNRLDAAQKISQILNDKKISQVIFGIPENPTTRARIMHFAGLVETTAEKFFINEDFSSVEAEREILHMKKLARQKSRKNGHVDSLSACKILQRFLEHDLKRAVPAKT